MTKADGPNRCRPTMVFEVEMTVWRKGRMGWEPGCVAGQVFDFDCWYDANDIFVLTGSSGRSVFPRVGVTVSRLVRLQAKLGRFGRLL